MAKATFVTLTPGNTKTNNQNITIQIGNNYTSLMNKIESLISITMSAMEAKEASITVHHSDDDIIQALSIAKELIPFPEIEFLDNIYNRFVVPRVYLAVEVSSSGVNTEMMKIMSLWYKYWTRCNKKKVVKY